MAVSAGSNRGATSDVAEKAADGATDRFENVPKGHRVGAHRAVAKSRNGWKYFVTALAAIVVVTFSSILWLNLASDTSNDPPPSSNGAEKEEPVQAVLDPEATVVVLNGTPEDGLEESVATAITDGEWGDVILASPAEKNDVEISAVFYSDEADLSAALGLGEKLGGMSAYETDAYEDLEARLVVLIGSDYVGPGGN